MSSRSSSSESDGQLLMGSSSLRSKSVVADSKLQTSGSVCITLIKGSLVQQKVSMSFNCSLVAVVFAADNR